MQENPNEEFDRFRRAIEATRDGIWDWDIVSGHVFFSPQFARLLGYESHEVQPTVDFFRDMIHPDDIPRAAAIHEEHFAGRLPEKQLELRLRTKSGNYRWYLERGEVVERDATGNPVRMVGTIADINDRKEAERVSSRALSLLRATLESTKDGILVVNSDETFEIYNQAFRNMCGIPSELLDSGTDDVAVRQMIEQIRDSGQMLEKIQFLAVNPQASSFDTLYLKDGRVFEAYSCPQIIDGQVVGRVWSFRDVTERKLAEEAQAEAHSRLQKIASRVPGVVYQYRLRPDGTASIPYASEGMRDLFGLEPKELFENADVSSKVVDNDSFLRSVLRSARDLTPWVHEMQIRRADGSVRWVSGNSVPEREPDGSTIWHGFITDITERKQAEAKLLDSERRLREAQAISQIGNFHWDAHTQRVTWSDELYRLYDRDPQNFEPTFESYVGSIHPEDRERVMRELQAAIGNRSAFDHQYRILFPNEKLRWVRARGNAIVDAQGEFLGLEGTCQDISEQKQTEATTASLEAQLRESQKMEAIGTLAGGIAHDFNNILATILGNVEIAIPESASGNPLVQNCLVNIRKAGDRARDLVQQILSFSRRQPTQRIPISLQAIVDDVARLLSATLPARLTLDIQCASDTPWILGDATQIKQVLLNLATNSMQAMNGDRGCIRILLDTMVLDGTADTNSQLRAVQSRSKGPLVRLIVSDDGPGMSPETLNRVFEPFFTTKPIDQGTGLGLAVVHGIVQRHEGAVTVESKLGKGATFAVYFPAAQHSAEPQHSAVPHYPAALPHVDAQQESSQQESSQQDNAQFNEVSSLEALASERNLKPEEPTSHHILYLDDDEAVLAVAEQLLNRGGFRTSCFSDHQSALNALRSNPSGFDLVVTDYNMPGMHGLEVAREIRSFHQLLPIVITSGYVDAELIAGADACGVQELIAKPFRLTELYAVVQRLVKQAP